MVSSRLEAAVRTKDTSRAGQQRRAAAQQGVEVLAHALRRHFVRGDEQKRPAQFARHGHGQVQFLRVIQPAGQRGPRTGKRVLQRAKLGKVFSGAKRQVRGSYIRQPPARAAPGGNWRANSSAVVVTARKSATGSARYTAMVLSMGNMAGSR